MRTETMEVIGLLSFGNRRIRLDRSRAGRAQPRHGRASDVDRTSSLCRPGERDLRPSWIAPTSHGSDEERRSCKTTDGLKIDLRALMSRSVPINNYVVSPSAVLAYPSLPLFGQLCEAEGTYTSHGVLQLGQALTLACALND